MKIRIIISEKTLNKYVFGGFNNPFNSRVHFTFLYRTSFFSVSKIIYKMIPAEIVIFQGPLDRPVDNQMMINSIAAYLSLGYKFANRSPLILELEMLP